MSRLTLLSSALAVSALALGAIGYAGTGAEARPGIADTAAGAVRMEESPAPSRRGADRSFSVAPGSDLTAALLRQGAGGLDAALVATQAGGVAGAGELWLGASVGEGSRAIERLELRSGGGRLDVIERVGDAFIRRTLVEAVDQTPVRIRINGGAALASGLVEARLPRGLRDEVIDLVGRSRIAAIDLIVAHEASASGSRYGQPLYLGAHRVDGSVERWIGDGGRLRPLAAAEPVDGGLLRPLPGPITSNPGLRFHPILRYLRWHRGTDFASPAGTPVQAAEAGRVVEAGWRGGYGRMVRLSHADGSSTLYAHLAEVGVSAGESVPRGAVIGAVGATGLATGPHLHFEWQRGGETLRPSFASAPSSVPGQVRGEGLVRLQRLLSLPFRLPPVSRT